MKKALIILSLLSVAYSCNKTEQLPPDTYEVNASAKGIHNGIRAYLKIVNDKRKEVIIDTAIVMNESLSFKGKINSSSVRLLSVNGVSGNLSFILEPSKINIEIFKDSIYFSKVGGSKNNEVFNLYKKEQREQAGALYEIRQQINAAKTSGDNDLYSELMEKNVAMTKEASFFVYQFIEEHSNSDLSLLLLENLISGSSQNIEKIKDNITSLTMVINKNPSNKLIGNKIEKFIRLKEAQANLEIGKIAPNFTSATPNGEILSLNDIKGKVTIIEFWAAWCGPCRRENPHIVKVYNQYHEKGLEIIGVSLDGTGRQKDPKAVWLKAIEDDKLTWHHVSSLKYFNDPVAQLYNINSIPASFILDEDGKIVAKNLRGQALEDQIASMLD